MGAITVPVSGQIYLDANSIIFDRQLNFAHLVEHRHVDLLRTTMPECIGHSFLSDAEHVCGGGVVWYFDTVGAFRNDRNAGLFGGF